MLDHTTVVIEQLSLNSHVNCMSLETLHLTRKSVKLLQRKFHRQRFNRVKIKDRN